MKKNSKTISSAQVDELMPTNEEELVRYLEIALSDNKGNAQALIKDLVVLMKKRASLKDKERQKFKEEYAEKSRVELERLEKIHNERCQQLNYMSHDCKSMISVLGLQINRIHFNALRKEDFEVELVRLEALVMQLECKMHGYDFLSTGSSYYDGEMNFPTFNQMIKLLVKKFNALWLHENKSFEIMPYDTNLSSQILISELSLKTILFNLLDNAAKFSFSDTKVRINVNFDLHENTMKCWIKNTGLSLTQEIINNCCKKFWRGREAGRVSPGSGLGLYIVSNIALSCQGSFEITSTRNKTIACFKIPIRERKGK